MISPLTARFAILYPDDCICENDDKEKYLFQKLYNLCLSFSLSALVSPLHSPDGDMKKKHYHIIFLGRISSTRWAVFLRSLKSDMPFISVFPDVKEPSELKAYMLYMTHSTEASKDKEQFSEAQKEVTEWLAF